jgi:hypothetical protein
MSIQYSDEQLCGIEGCARVKIPYPEDEPCGLAKLFGINTNLEDPLCGVTRTVNLWEKEGFFEELREITKRAENSNDNG